MSAKETAQVVCVAEVRVLAGKTDALVSALRLLMKPTHKEPVWISYEVNQRDDDPRWITFIEKWRDKKTFDEHCAMPYITHYFNAVRPSLGESFEGKLGHEVLP